MSETDDNEEHGGDDLLAAELVLGVLAAAERKGAVRHAETDRDFALRVERWEEQFAPMSQAYGAVEAPQRVKAAIDRRLFASTAAVASAGGGFWASLAFWRGLAAAALAALIVSATLPFVAPAPQSSQFVASLRGQDSDVRFVAVTDQTSGAVALSHVSGDADAAHDFELWLIEGGNAPVSMGVLPAGTVIRIALSPDVLQRLAAGAVLAISLEPDGGSPTGQPTGPVVATGDLRAI